MARIARVVVPGAAHHITQRGIRRFDVFADETDREVYLDLLGESCRLFGLQLLAYCLMTNHVHHVAIPERKDSIYKVFHRVHGRYSHHFNGKYGFVGHLWQARPYSCVLEQGHRVSAIRYVELNPVRAGMVAEAPDYRWSSAAAHCGLREDALLAPLTDPPRSTADWAAWLAVGNAPEVDYLVRECTFTGRPCGDATFTIQIERATGRNFSRQKPGPKPKSPAESVALLNWHDYSVLK